MTELSWNGQFGVTFGMRCELKAGEIEENIGTNKSKAAYNKTPNKLWPELEIDHRSLGTE